MCYHRLFIYSACGHSVFSRAPIIVCEQAATFHNEATATSCKIEAHPFQSWKLDSLCPACDEQRTTLLTEAEERLKIRYVDWKWKVSYGMPKHGKDFWGRKADERAQLERETGKRKRFSMPFRWKKTWKTKFGQVVVEPAGSVQCTPALMHRQTVRSSAMIGLGPSR